MGENISCNKVSNKRVLIYIPSREGLFDYRVVYGLMYLLMELYSLKKDGWEFYPIIARRMFIHDARNLACEHALENNMDYILFLDDDMVINPDTKLFTKLISHNVDMVAPLFFQRMSPYLPLLFKKKVLANGRYVTYENILDFEKGLIEVDGVGFGCVLIKTEILKKIKKPYFLMGDTFGEDLYFCNKVKEAGFKIYCDTEITIGHIGEAEICDLNTYIKNKDIAKEFVLGKAKKDENESKKLIPDVDIIMPCYHNYETTRDAIESILNFTSGVNYKLILINDGGDKKLDSYFKKLKKHRDNIISVSNIPSIGYIKSINSGISLSSNPYVLFINNDILIKPENPYWLLSLCESFDNDVGAVAPISNYVLGLQNIEYNKQIFLQSHYSKFLIGFCFLTKRKIIEEIGLLDERFGIGGNDDLDYSIRIRKAGYKLKILRNVFVYHKGFQSLGMIYKDYSEVEESTRKLLIDKWGKEEVDSLFTFNMKFLQDGEE